ncbi:MAG: restriction endonuclease subunit S [Bacteroidetes bacterium]|nr:restriction endonuclease subunit S [Bacteroidota bacterium]
MSKYETYKPSGIDWIGEVPLHWQRQRIKTISENLDGKRVPLNSGERFDVSGDIPYYGATGIVDYVSDFLFDEELVLIGEDGAPFFEPIKDVSFIIQGKSWVNNHAHVLRCDKNRITPKFLMHWLNVVDYANHIKGSTRDKLNQKDLGGIEVYSPILSEQLTIANYLDHQTQKIDRLIANKKAQAEKLKELRQIEINNAVTKGLNPNAELKDSGIDWLGKIPKHWAVKRLKNVSEKITDGEHIAPNFTDSGMPFLSAKDVRENEILFEEDKFVSEIDGLSFRQRCNPERGDALIVSRGATVGRVSIVKTDRIFCLRGSVILIKPTNKINSEFLFYALTNPKIQENLYQTSQSSAQQAIYLVNISFLKLAIPPIEEQIEISKVLVDKTKLIDNLIKNIETQIEKLQEFRKIKIYEAVTGKIKVNAYVEATA